MSQVLDIINFILDLGPSVVMPIIIFILSLIFGLKVSRAVRSALTVGIGFIAVNLVIGLLIETLSPATKAMVQNLGINLNVMDVGWPVAAAISFATTSVVPWVFILGITLNIVLVLINFTKTLDIDMWNYWHFIFGAGFVYVITDSLFVALFIALLTELIVLKLADWTAPIVQDYFEFPGISLPHTETVSWAPVSWVLNRLIDRIPIIRNWQMDPDTIQKRWGVIGEPIMVGTILGGIIAFLGYGPDIMNNPATNIKNILTTAISMGAVMLVLPRMVRLLMEGLMPLSDGAREFLKRRFPGRNLYIGLDAAIAIGHPAVISTALLLVPITLVLSILLSLIGANRMLPFTDLAVLPFLSIWAVGWSRGNIVRGVLIGSVFMACILVIGTFLAPMTTQLAVDAKFDIPKGALQISSLDVGAHLSSWLLVLPFSLGTLFNEGIGFTIVALFVAIFTVISYIVFIVAQTRGKVSEVKSQEAEGIHHDL